MIVYARQTDADRYFRLRLTQRQARRLDNGAMVSCGLALTGKQISRLDAEEMTKDEWNHSGCQSRCVMRGDNICQW
jgi:hypothetical protein